MPIQKKVYKYFFPRKYNFKYPQENVVEWIFGIEKVQNCLNIDFGKKTNEMFSYANFPMIPGSVQTNNIQILKFVFNLW